MKLIYCKSRSKARKLAKNGRKTVDNGPDSKPMRRWAVKL